MKKKILSILITILTVCMLMFTLSACGDKTPQITGITVSGQAEVYIDEFDYADYTITATYDNGTTEDVALLAEHLSAEDNAKISTVGTHALTVTYSGKTATLSLTVKNHDFYDVTFEDKTVTYNGLPQTIEVSGLPSGANVSYSPNNTYTEVGEYPVTATITKQYYNDLQLTATLKITNIMRKITFVQAGVEDIVKEVVDGGTLSKNEIPTPQEINGYEVTWNRTDFTNITDNITVEVVKSLKTYKIEYVLYGGENDKNNPLSYNVESYDIIIRAPQKEGFTFDGWYLENSFDNKTTKIETGSYGDIKLYAKWTGNVNGLNFNGNGNTSGSMNAVTLKTGETKAIPLNTFVKTGYTFKGWSTSANGDVIYNDCADYTMGTESQYTIYAVWEANLNTLTFNGNGATGGSTSSMQIRTDATTTLNKNGFTRTKYLFAGWAETQNGAVKYTDGATYTMGTNASYTLYAVWTLDENEITFNGNGNTSGSMPNQTVYNNGNKVLNNNSFTKTGYHFIGWAESADGEVKYTDGATATFVQKENYTLYAKWESNLNTLTFNGNGATSGSTSSMQIKSDESATLNSNGFTKTGYTFKGWSTSVNGEVEYLNGASYTMGLNSSYTLYAVWEENVNGLNFDGNGNTSGSMNAVTLKTGETKAIPLNTFVKMGYTFKGWSTSANGSVVYNNGANYTMGTNSQYTLYAVWEANLNTLTFNGNGATSGSTSSMQIRTDASKALNANGFTRAGYTFKGWSTTANGTVEFEDGDTYLMGTDSEYTLYAVWDIVKYNIAYVLDDGENSSENLLYITHLTSLPIALSNAYKTGYTFGGWYLNKDFLGSAITEITELKEITLYALWLEGSEGLTYSLLNGEYSVTGYEGADDVVVIPSTYNDFKVTKIESNAFRESKIKSITIGENIVEIGSSAFSNCYELLEIIYNATNCDYIGAHNNIFSNCGQKGSGIFVTIGKNVKRIPESLFSPTKDGSYYPKIISVEFEENSICESIGEYAFNYCTELKTIILSESIRKIGLYAFSYVPSPLEYNNLYYIGTRNNPYFVVTGCKSGVVNLSIHDDTRIIKPKAFAEKTTTRLKITVPENIIYIGEQAFYNCKYLVELNYNINSYPDFTSFSHKIFYQTGMHAGYRLVIGSNVKKIPAFLFGDDAANSYIKEVIFEQNSSCESIGKSTFRNNYSLKNFIIPKDVNDLSASAFVGCGIENIQVEDGNTTYKSINGSIYSIDEKTLIRFAPGTTSGGSGTINLSNIEIIGEWAISGCEELYWKVLIPKTVKKIETGAFANSQGIKTIVYEGSVDEWVEIEFESQLKSGLKLYCGNSDSLLENVVLTSAKKISNYAFSGITSIKSIEISNNVEYIGEGAFINCTSLKTVKMTDGVKSIGESAFSNCSSLDNITIGNGVESIGDYAFAHCSSLTNIEIPNNVVTMGDGTFYGCSSLTNVNFEEDSLLTSIGEEAFFDCSSLTSIETPNNVVTIGDRAFYRCISLNSIIIPKSVIRINDFAFHKCTSLTTVYYGGRLEEWIEVSVGDNNVPLANSTNYFYVENESDLPADNSNYWHYVDGVPTVWTKD